MSLNPSLLKLLLKIVLAVFLLSLLNLAVFSQADKKLSGELAKMATTAQGRVGVAMTVLETNESVSISAEQRFPMQSVYKFPIGMMTLHLVDQGKLSLEQKIAVSKDDYVRSGQHSPVRDTHPTGATLTIRELLRYTVSESDGSTSDVLLRLVGGAQAVTSYLRELGVTGIIVADTEKEIGRDISVQYRNWATPNAAVLLLRKLQEGKALSATSRALLLKLMTETPTGLHRLKGLLPAGTIVVHKTGTSGTTNGLTHTTNDIGIVTLPNGQHLIIAVFVSDSRADEKVREGVIAQVARAAWNFWTQPSN